MIYLESRDVSTVRDKIIENIMKNYEKSKLGFEFFNNILKALNTEPLVDDENDEKEQPKNDEN